MTHDHDAAALLQAESSAEDAAWIPDGWLRDQNAAASAGLLGAAATAEDAGQPQQDCDTLGAEAQGLREQQLPASEPEPGRSAAVIAAPGVRGLKPTRREKNIMAQRLWRLKQKARLCSKSWKMYSCVRRCSAPTTTSRSRHARCEVDVLCLNMLSHISCSTPL
jgi:hypothetical protein